MDELRRIPAPVTTLTVNIAPEAVAALNNVAEREGISITAALGRLVSYGDVVYRASRNGKQIILSGRDSDEEMVIR